MAEKLSPLTRLRKELDLLSKRKRLYHYKVPSLWIPVGGKVPEKPGRMSVNPGRFFLDHVDAIKDHALDGIDPSKSLNGQIPGGKGGAWAGHEKIYNLMVRLSTAFDHDGNGTLGGNGADPTLNEEGVRESGTFLKTIALLGHIKRLGCTVLHLLPVTSIGRDGNKGKLGSPYAIRNPYVIEPTQADPLVRLSPEDQFKALLEACHLLGIRVVAEFVFRTASKDGDWVAEHPDWFYWIDDRIEDRPGGEIDPAKAGSHYGNPIFPAADLEKIKAKVEKNDFHELPEPPKEFRDFFKLPPAPDKVTRNPKGQFRGEGTDPETGKAVSCRIPGAFADWPPDDTQPPWNDVTYLRMYLDRDPKKPRFNYIAYNTIRMYDSGLADDSCANRPLWEKIRDLIPFYQEEYGIDGVMVDMGHAVPVKLMQEIVDTARKKDPDFAFLSENFSIEESSVKAGYNAVVGYAWWVEYKREGLLDLLDHIGRRGVPIPFFGTPENHNTPRAAGRPGGEKYARYSFLVNTMLPNSVPFIHSGFELGETHPVNTGLDFTVSDLKRLSGVPLPLFDLCALNWEYKGGMIDFTAEVLALRERFAAAVKAPHQESFILLKTIEPDVIGFIRRGGGNHVMVLVNRDLEKPHEVAIDLGSHLPPGARDVRMHLAQSRQGSSLPVQQGLLRITLDAGESLLLSW